GCARRVRLARRAKARRPLPTSAFARRRASADKSGARWTSTPRLAAAGGFGVFDRAEPARALCNLHLDLRVPAAGRLVIDALAGGVDIALDGAVGRGRDLA